MKKAGHWSRPMPGTRTNSAALAAAISIVPMPICANMPVAGGTGTLQPRSRIVRPRRPAQTARPAIASSSAMPSPRSRSVDPASAPIAIICGRQTSIAPASTNTPLQKVALAIVTTRAMSLSDRPAAV